jgi:hypothetical protein
MRPTGVPNGREPQGGYPDVSDYLGGFLAGFIEGEGSLCITKRSRGFGYQPSMSLAVRDDDADLIGALATATRIGSRRQP